MLISETTIEKLKEFLEFESADNLSALLSRMLGNYIATAPVDKKQLANAAYVVSKITSLFYNIDKLQNQTGAPISVHILEDKKECMPS